MTSSPFHHLIMFNIAMERDIPTKLNTIFIFYFRFGYIFFSSVSRANYYSTVISWVDVEKNAFKMWMRKIQTINTCVYMLWNLYHEDLNRYIDRFIESFEMTQFFLPSWINGFFFSLVRLTVDIIFMNHFQVQVVIKQKIYYFEK